MDIKYANRVSVLLSNIKANEVLILGKNGITTSFLVLEKRSVRGAQGYTNLTLKNLATSEVSTFNKKEYLQTATCETDSIGYRKAQHRIQPLVTPVAASTQTAPVAPTVPAVEVVTPSPAPAVAALPIYRVEVQSVNSKFSEIGVNVQNELEEVLKLFETGNTEAAIDRLLN